MTVILIYLVLASLFESYSQPMLIMFALPLSIMGVAFSLWAFNKPISLGVWIGTMILFGSVVTAPLFWLKKLIPPRRQEEPIAGYIRIVLRKTKAGTDHYADENPGPPSNGA